ncbi:hypothetical protein GCM10027592_08240 [Spirosoma flavus]
MKHFIPVNFSLKSLIHFGLFTILILLTIPLHAQLITTMAGNGTFGYGGDGGLATAASMEFPTDIAIDKKGNVFIVDNALWNIRKVAPNGLITTVVGGRNTGPLFYPSSIAIDNNNQLFITDSEHHRICKLDTNGVLTTVAGNGTLGFNGDGGLATAASLARPWGITVDGLGNIFIADTENHRIRKIDTNGIITTVAGTGVSALSGDGGPATAASLNQPRGITTDNQGNLFIADQGNNRIRKIDTNGTIKTVAGSTQLYEPFDVAVDIAGNLFIAENQNNCIRMIDPSGTMTTAIGNGQYAFGGDGGYAEKASLKTPFGVTIDNRGNLYVADMWNYRVRKVTGFIISKQDGNWPITSTWNCQCLPTINDSITILPGHNVTVGEAVQTRTLKPFGRLTFTPNGKIYIPAPSANPF